jgi:TRAP-type mannitol/chloroaromatic compound transport system permease large subunit
VQAVRSGSGITVTVIGYSTSRELQTANFTFTVLGVGQTPVTVSLVDIANNKWYGTSASIPYGSQFLYTQPFTVTQGNATDVSGVAVVLSNSMGTMLAPFSAQIQ